MFLFILFIQRYTAIFLRLFASISILLISALGYIITGSNWKDEEKKARLIKCIKKFIIAFFFLDILSDFRFLSFLTLS